MKHPDKKQLIDILLNSSKPIELKTAAHIKECKECADTMEALRIIMKASDNSSIAPSKRIKTDLLSNIDNNIKIKRSKKYIIPVKTILRPAIAAAAVIVIAFTAILIFTNRDVTVNITLNLSPDHGNIIFDNNALRNPAEIKQGHIKSGDISSAVLALGRALSVKIAGDTDLSLISAQEYPDKDNKKYNVSFNLKAGSIMVSSNHGLMNKYTIFTPHAVFEPVGTEFVLSSDENSSKLSVTEGIVRVTAKDKSETVLQKGEGCEVGADGIKKFGIDTESVIKSFNAEFSRKKTQNAPAAKKALNNDIPETPSTSAAENNEEIVPSSDTQTESGRSVNDTREFSKEKSEMRNDVKDTKKEIRKGSRPGKGR